jgi:hypothetical protein
MDPNPYQPPRPDRAATAVDPNHPLSAEKESEVMREIGRRRARGFKVGFAIAWPLSLGVLMFGVSLGFIPAMIGSAALAAALSKLLVKMRKEEIIRSVLAAHGVPEGVFDPSKFIVD